MSQKVSDGALSDAQNFSSFSGSILGTAYLFIEDLWHSLAAAGDISTPSDLQLQVLTAFLVILGVNVVLIGVFWKLYSQRISHTLASNRVLFVEDLLKRNSPVKLPKEHSPRIRQRSNII